VSFASSESLGKLVVLLEDIRRGFKVMFWVCRKYIRYALEKFIRLVIVEEKKATERGA